MLAWCIGRFQVCSLRQVEVDLALNAHANARWHHELRKKHLGKLQKTVDANAVAFKAAEKRTSKSLVQVLMRQHSRAG